MTPIRANYERLPTFRRDSVGEHLEDDFKDKPVQHRHHLSRLLRKSRRLTSRLCRPHPLLALLFGLLGLQLLWNGSYGQHSAPKFQVNKAEKVFIAANIINGELIESAWGPRLLSLIELIGSDRTFVSIYGGPSLELRQLEEKLKCNHKIVIEESEPIKLDTLPKTMLPDGLPRIKRIAFLAQVRNKVLEPLVDLETQGIVFGKVLFINDVYFEPAEALRLIWGTNVDEHGNAEYKAACAADFSTSWKYYDTFATRDAEGYSLGVPIYPWFSSEGEAVSRKDVLAGRDAVRVKSCWGGMVSFDARYFTPNSPSLSDHARLNTSMQVPLPLRFRSEPEPFWDSSECCLIHADISALPDLHRAGDEAREHDSGIYMNPYVRTAYSEGAFAWIPVAKRFERLLAPLQHLINRLAQMPRPNYRRTEVAGQLVDDQRWISYSLSPNRTSARVPHRQEASADVWRQRGFYEKVKRVARRGGYCGVRQLLVLKEEEFSEEDNGKGGQNWDNLLASVPPLDL
ncbi:hypothetical protein BGHDH14_bgh05865 [Blumeria hordei DH14]|uniref:Glycosyltransferase family 69 protein n=1 Tax=Blumeria graminis f. sp. hordei (strain DH14) TaxID=546991 RepID=N1JLF4_BLUG1|nr:hypothetical protein BGHDH14_bgh05865 [Blumeria hordei DH14]